MGDTLSGFYCSGCWRAVLFVGNLWPMWNGMRAWSTFSCTWPNKPPHTHTDRGPTEVNIHPDLQKESPRPNLDQLPHLTNPWGTPLPGWGKSWYLFFLELVSLGWRIKITLNKVSSSRVGPWHSFYLIQCLQFCYLSIPTWMSVNLSIWGPVNMKIRSYKNISKPIKSSSSNKLYLHYT